MHGSTLAIVLCLALGPAVADEAIGPRKPAADGLMHAALIVPAPAAQAGTLKPQAALMPAKSHQAASLQEDKEAPAPEQRRPVLAMLLAAFAVMTGIVLRRWSGGQS